MTSITLNNIDNSFESYEKLIDFYEKCKNLEYEDISVKIELKIKLGKILIIPYI